VKHRVPRPSQNTCRADLTSNATTHHHARAALPLPTALPLTTIACRTSALPSGSGHASPFLPLPPRLRDLHYTTARLCCYAFTISAYHLCTPTPPRTSTYTTDLRLDTFCLCSTDAGCWYPLPLLTFEQCGLPHLLLPLNLHISDAEPRTLLPTVRIDVKATTLFRGRITPPVAFLRRGVVWARTGNTCLRA